MDKLIVEASCLRPKVGKSVELLLDDQTGIVNAVLERRLFKSFGLHSFQALASKTSISLRSSHDSTSGGMGIHARKSYALLGAFGEAVERYCLSFIDSSAIRRDCYRNLPLAQRPLAFGLYSENQYKNHREFVNPKSSSIEWIQCSALKKQNRSIWWPASLVFVPSGSLRRVAETTSTGTSAALSRSRSIRSGLLEVLERDALSISFLNRLPVMDVRLTSMPRSESSFIRKISRRFNIRIMRLLSSTFVPVYCSIIWRGAGRNIHYGIGGGCDLDSVVAVRKSLVEALFTFHYSQDVMDLRITNPDDIKALYEHFLFYQRENFPLLPFKTAGIENFRRTRLSYLALLDKLESAGFHPYAVDLTTRDVKALGWYVTKIIVPGMCDINPTHKLAREGCSRLSSVPRVLGFSTPADLYALPHPFP